VVRLIAGEVKPTDHPGDNKYSRAAGFFAEWLRTGVLKPEPSPCLYAYRQTFNLPGSEEVRSRTGLLCVVELEPLGTNVLGHERTHARPKADRLSLTQAVEANLSPVFSLYEDPSGVVRRILRATEERTPRFSIATDGGEGHVVWCLRGTEEFRALASALRPSTLFIADGHHRYETALNFRNKQRLAYPQAPPDAAFNFVLMLLVATDDPGLMILPTHRLLRGMDGFNGRALVERLRGRATVRQMRDRGSLLAEMEAEVEGHRIGIASAAGLWTLDLPRDAGTASPVGALDVVALHREVFERELGLHEGILDSELHLSYSRNPGYVLDQVDRGQAQAAFLLRPPRVSDVLAVARAGEVMPQKSTYFYPKPLSGVVFNPLSPAIRIAAV
jgi:uncharacterized protein (DUF1015 family)